MLYQAPKSEFWGEPSKGVASKDDVALWRQNLINRFPVPFRKHLNSHHKRTAKRTGYADANRELNRLYNETLLPGFGVNASATDGQIRDYSETLSARLKRDFFAMANDDSEKGPKRGFGKRAALEWLKLELDRRDLELDIDTEKTDELISYLARIFEPDYWVRLLKKRQRYIMEQVARLIRMVNVYSSPYCSDWTLDNRRSQKSRNKRILEGLEAVSEDGEAVNLWDCVQSSVANPELRRMELMTRMRGFEDVAGMVAHVSMFYTVTTPSKYHCHLSKANVQNPKYQGATPREAQDYLTKLWAKFRAKLHRNGIVVYGFRVAEPHHDGTPHWHLLLFMRPEDQAFVTSELREYTLAEDREEVRGCEKVRFEAVEIDPEKGSATGYIAKYIAKNIDGAHVGIDDETGDDALSSAERVDAWASCWGIRQFQQIGGPSVTVWRELRRLSEDEVSEMVADNDYVNRGGFSESPVQRFLADKADEESKRIEKLWNAADNADWAAFCLFQGGPTMPRHKHFLKLWKNQLDEEGNPLENRFGEVIQTIQGLKIAMVGIGSRSVKWAIRAVRSAATSEAQASPWSTVNNCTGPPDKELIRLDLGREMG